MPTPASRIRHIACLLGVASLVCACAAAPLASLRAGPPEYAWWLRVEFHPRGQSLRGVSARRIRQAWCAVDELTPALFEPFERDDMGAQSGAHYDAPGPYVDGRRTVLVIAAFRECDGPTGTAMVLLDSGARPRRAIAVEPLVSPAGYAMIGGASQDRVHVVFCQECDHAVEYEWDPLGKRFVEQAYVDPAE